MARTNPGDLVVMCVDKHAQVVSELENRTHSAQAGAHSSELVGDPDLDPAELARDAEVQGQEAEVEALAADHEAAEEADAAEVART
jgi:cyanophycin synthetase